MRPGHPHRPKLLNCRHRAHQNWSKFEESDFSSRPAAHQRKPIYTVSSRLTHSSPRPTVAIAPVCSIAAQQSQVDSTRFVNRKKLSNSRAHNTEQRSGEAERTPSPSNLLLVVVSTFVTIIKKRSPTQLFFQDAVPKDFPHQGQAC